MYRYSLEYLTQWSQDKSRKPIVIRGARQVGKSTLVRMFASLSGLSLLELNFERNPELVDFFKSNDPQKIIQLISLQTAKDITPGKTLLFLDEIQAAAAAIVSLRYFYEELPQLHVIAAGSLLEFTLSQASFSMPVGRIEYLHLGVMTFDEFLLAVNEKALAEFLKTYQLNQQIPTAIHDKLMDLVKVYLITGGMPASIAAYVNDRSFKQSEKVKQSILSTYQDDFGKYAALSQHDVIRQVFTKIPTMIGNKFKYVQINPNIKSSTIAAALQQLCLARVAWKIHHSSANGVPLGAEKNDRLFKVLFLDVGLVSTSLGLNYLDLVNEIELINSGNIVEQFVGQHLLYSDLTYEQPNLYYWVREKKSSSAELDYVINIGQQIIPIEVKAGKTGQMKSLQIFLKEKHRKLALRFNSAPASQMDATTKLVDGSSVDFKFISLPLYLIGQFRRIVGSCF